MSLDSQLIQHLHDILEAGFPGLRDFGDPRFLAIESDYKRKASEAAQTWFSKTALEAAIENEPETLRKRVHSLANKTNLLFLGVPKKGDLSLLYTGGLNATELGERLIDLLHGPDDSPTRLQRLSDWAHERGLPNKWTFPTFLLFLVHPQTELFVKPRVTGDFLKLVESGVALGTVPSASVYEHLLGLCEEIRTGLADLGPSDMIDVQSMIFIAREWGKDMELSDERREEVTALIEEFRTGYAQTDEGAGHLSTYRTMRESAIANFRSLQEAKKQGKETTNPTLLKLLPHKDSKANRERGAWIHVAPAIQRDLRLWFENKGWVEPGSWPKVAQALLEFVEHLKEHPEDLAEKVHALNRSGLGTGFQSGMLSPILNALRPDQFMVLNAKSRRVINYFLGLTHDPVLTDYPASNRAGRYLANQLRDKFTEGLPTETLQADAFDAFCHWLVAVRKYPFGKSKAWRVQIHDTQVWDRWSRDGGIEYPDNGVGDATERALRDWKTPPAGADPEVVDAIRHLSLMLKEGDQVVVFDEQSVVRGIGAVAGNYEYHEGEDPTHVLPVDWQDTTARKSSDRKHKQLIKTMHVTEVDALRVLPIIDLPHASDAIFTSRTFELLEGLNKDPVKAYYVEHRKDFSEYLEGPFKRLLQSVAAELPTPMREVLETEKGLFSRILKNDWGRGGAWSHYWGALYPKGQKRIAGAQLFVGVNRSRLEWGFYVGEYADQVTEAILSQFRRRGEALRAILQKHIEADRFWFGAEEAGGEIVEGTGTRSLDEWMRSLDGGSLAARVSLHRDEVLRMSKVALRDRIVGDFLQLFPLVLAAIYENPIAAIKSFARVGSEIEVQPEYSLDECAADTGFDIETLSMWNDAIERKRQAVFYGPPGTGKTFMAEALAKVLIGGGDGFSEVVQFHPAYAYEDFMQGIRPRPSRNGGLEFTMVPGRFLDFCREAQCRSDTCVLIVDEFNRANLSRVFGELMYLLEYRDQAIPLAGGGQFKIPENVRIIGTMNTADRSIALVDHALRRRFAFLALRPRDEVLRHFHEETRQSVDAVIEKLAELNKAIDDENYHIGITFFMDSDLDKNLEAIWRMEIEPYLEEYFFDDPATVDRFRWDQVGTDLMGSE